jgi:hypothetical protein
MVFKSSPSRRLGVQVEIDSWHRGRQAPHAYGIWSRRLGVYGVNFFCKAGAAWAILQVRG